jgi:RpiR family carbohydrate utilization transcriptional regulator
LRSVAEVILADPLSAQSLNIHDLAEKAEVADSTVSRFLRELGLSGYKELRIEIARAVFGQGRTQNELSRPYVYEGILPGDVPAEVVRKVFGGASAIMAKTAESLDVDILTQVVREISTANTLNLFAMGSSALAVENALMRFARAGKRAAMHRDQSVQVIMSATLGSGDLVIAFSDSGESDSVVQSTQIAKLHGAKTVAVTSSRFSRLAIEADYVIVTGAQEEGSSVYGEAVTSKWGQLLVIDALYAMYALSSYDETIGFLEESYISAIASTRKGTAEDAS